VIDYSEFKRHYNYQPHEVSIETQALCNARCTFCPYPTIERKGTKMPDELLYRLIDEMAAFKLPFYFSPFKLNEPFLDKRLIPLCQYFNEKCPNGVLRLFTNGSALTEKHLDGVAGLKNIAHLWISLNHHDPQEYEQLMGLDFEKTASKLDMLHAREFPHPVVVSKVGSQSNGFVEYVSQRWPKFQISLIKKDAWIDFTEPDSPEVPNTPCNRWWELNISADGIVRTCCMDDGEDPRWAIGDIKDDTLLNVYNSPFWKHRRANLISRKQLDDRSPCSRCSYGN
jgi:MoaA/NifB/PqqE/SkfB family radical SAM enzyme